MLQISGVISLGSGDVSMFSQTQDLEDLRGQVFTNVAVYKVQMSSFLFSKGALCINRTSLSRIT